MDVKRGVLQRQDVGESLEGATVYDDDVIRPLDNAIYQEGALALLKGNLAPDGSACEPRLLKHSGPALVFDTYEQLKTNIDREDLDVTADHVLVLLRADIEQAAHNSSALARKHAENIPVEKRVT